MPNHTGLSPHSPNKYLGPNVYLATVVTRTRAPTGADYRQPETGKLYPFNTFWLVGKDPTTGVEGDMWYLSKIEANVGYWIKLGESSGGPLLNVTVDDATPPGVNPVEPSGSGTMVFTGAQVASAVIGANVIRTETLALNTITWQIQQAGSAVSKNTALNGVAHFNSSQFTVDEGFVSLGGGGLAIDSVQVDAFTAPGTNPVVPTSAGLITVTGAQVAAGTVGTNVIRSNSIVANTYRMEIQRSTTAASTTVAANGVAHFDSARFTVDANGFVSTSATGVLNTLSDDVGTVITPAAGNIQLVGHVNQQGGGKFSTVVAGTNLANINPMSIARWIVDPLGFNGTHTTLTSAMASASSGDTIVIVAGSKLTENVTLKAGVNVVGLTGDQLTPNVTIIGNLTASFAGTCSLGNIRLQTNSAACLTVSGSNATVVNLYNTFINATNATAISYTSSSSSSSIRAVNCWGNITTTGIALFASSSAGQISFNYSNIANTGGSTTANTVSAGSLLMFSSSFGNPITSSGTAICAFLYSDFSTLAINTTAFTNGGSGNATAFMCRFVSGTATAIVTTQLLTIGNSTVDTTNAVAISGAGSIQFSNVSFATTKVITVTTQSGGAAPGVTNTSPAAGFLGERLTNTVTALAPANATPTGVITLALTPGVWDISAIGAFSYSGNSSASIINISSVNNTLTGTLGDAYAQYSQANTTGFITTLSVPAFRVAVTANTNYFCVVQANYSTGAVSLNARMSAVRVG